MGARFKLPFKRRLRKKTDYKARLALVSSGKLRLVVRKTERHMKMQLINYDPTGDKTLATATSQELQGLGWKYSTSNTPAAYLTGILIAKKAKKVGVEEAVLDIGIQRNVKGSKIYAAVKGALDGGLSVPVSEEVLPSEDRIKGEHIVKYSKEKGDNKFQFSKVNPENMVKDFESIKQKLMKD